jgi:hypothetical protein
MHAVKSLKQASVDAGNQDEHAMTEKDDFAGNFGTVVFQFILVSHSDKSYFNLLSVCYFFILNLFISDE